jgi:threonine/homoserine efflux transporter RhtA
MARLSRATYSLMVSLLPATATVIGIIVLAQVPSPIEILGVTLVVAAVAVHTERPETASTSDERTARKQLGRADSSAGRRSTA